MVTTVLCPRLLIKVSMYVSSGLVSMGLSPHHGSHLSVLGTLNSFYWMPNITNFTLMLDIYFLYFSK